MSQQKITPYQKGFQRIKSLATSSLMGIGMLAGGSARAAPTNLSFTVTAGSARWTEISNSTADDNSILTSAFGIGEATLTNSFPTINVSGTTTTTTTTTATNGGIFTHTHFNTISTNTGSDSLNDAFDGVLGLNVNGTDFNNPDGDVDLTGTTVTTDIATIAGLEVEVQYHFFPTRPLVRAVFTFTNPTAAAIALTATTGGDLGSDGGTEPQATSDSDTLIEDTDLWYITSDNPTGFNLPHNDPILTFARYGTGAAVIPTNTRIPGKANDRDSYSYQYVTSVPAGKTYKIMVFIELNPNVADAIAEAADFESLTALNGAGLLAGLTPADQALIVNYGPLAPTATLTPIPVMTVWGIGSLSMMLGLFGFRQQAKKQKL